MRKGPVRGGRYEIKYATMVDLIHLAYNIDTDKILGGPNWLEMDRFDITGKVPTGATPETLNLMLQSALADRFKLAVHKDTKPLPAFVLVAGKKPLLKAAAGTEEAGCKVGSESSAGAEGNMRIMMGAAVANSGGAPQMFSLGPGGTILYNCRNMTMAAFVEGLPKMFGASSLGTNPILEQTGLKGGWNFDVRWTAVIGGLPGGNQAEHISVSDAIEKQLGLKLEERQVPTPVLIVDSVNEKPSENPPGAAEALPAIPTPSEFEVASIKPADPGGRGFRYQMQTGGRLTATGYPLHNLVNMAFNVNANEQIAGVPPFADAARFDIIAKAPADGPDAPALDRDSTAPMMRALLADRFKMTYHTEQRPVSAYSLMAAKTKMKKADPASRTFCKIGQAPTGAPAGSSTMTCQNVTMAQFADRLQGITQELNWPVLDTTGLEGGWDFTLTFSRGFNMTTSFGGAGVAGMAIRTTAPGGDASASDLLGMEISSIFEAIEKQLGLKLEKQKRNEAVIVIDHLEEKPTDN